MLNTPVALSVFNRPETTESVFRAIAQAKPNRRFSKIFSNRMPPSIRLTIKWVEWDS